MDEEKPKIRILSRNPDDYIRETKFDLPKMHRNYAPELHPFKEAREYTRALNATKLERLFAKPFLGNLDGHSDGVSCMSKFPPSLSLMLSGSYDGEIRVWNIPRKKCIAQTAAHTGFVRDLCAKRFDDDVTKTLSVGDDKKVNLWTLENGFETPQSVFLSKTVLSGVSQHHSQCKFVTCGEVVQLWDISRSAPLCEFQWGVDTVSRIRFNPIELDLVGAVAYDRSILLYDTRMQAQLRKVVLKLRSNAIAWNPMEAFVFTVANEDYSLYSFDLRNLRQPTTILSNHTAAVMDLDYSPTGQELVSGGYDKTVRIWTRFSGHSRDVYHTKRMQRVMCVLWSQDAKYIMSGSDEMNIRIWKANAAEKLGIVKPRERYSLRYQEKLKKKYQNHPEVKRIARHRQVPKHILNAQKEHRAIKQSKKRKDTNLRLHSAPGTVPLVPERKKHVVNEIK